MAEGNLVDMNTGGTEPSVKTGPKPKAPPTAFWVPETLNYGHGSAAELDQRLKAAGIKLRRELLQTCQGDIDAWTALMNQSLRWGTLVQGQPLFPNMLFCQFFDIFLYLSEINFCL